MRPRFTRRKVIKTLLTCQQFRISNAELRLIRCTRWYALLMLDKTALPNFGRIFFIARPQFEGRQ